MAVITDFRGETLLGFLKDNVAPGSNDYVICRKNRDVQRGNANARADRAQRNMAEQMLNNPTRP